MIIDQCRKLALRAPARVVFPDALDVRVLKAAHYLQQQGRYSTGAQPPLQRGLRDDDPGRDGRAAGAQPTAAAGR